MINFSFSDLFLGQIVAVIISQEIPQWHKRMFGHLQQWSLSFSLSSSHYPGKVAVVTANRFSRSFTHRGRGSCDYRRYEDRKKRRGTGADDGENKRQAALRLNCLR